MEYNNNKPMFFVITCVKEGRKLIWPLFESLIKQTKHNFIHYIYEDGSVDPLNEIIDEYIKKVNMLPNPYEVIYEKNEVNIGLNRATMHAIKRCTLNYFVWINCDDKVDVRFFEEMSKYIAKHKDGVVFRSNQIALNEAGDRIKLSEFERIKYAKKKNQLAPYLHRYYFWSTFIVKMSSYKEVNPNYYVDSTPYVFNDKQITFALINFYSDYFHFVKRAFSFYIERNNSEGRKYVDLNSNNELYKKNSFFYHSLISNIFPEKRPFHEKIDQYRELCDQFFIAYKNLQLKKLLICHKKKKDFIKINDIPKNVKNIKHTDLYYLNKLIIKKILQRRKANED